jgi:asparaginyl-tRNA synthetase
MKKTIGSIIVVNSRFPLNHGLELQTEHEKYLVEKVFRKPVFVTQYPSNVKPFYMKSSKSKALCMDLLMPKWGEIVGGSMREDNYEDLLKSIAAHQLDIKEYDWYLDLRKYGSVPHGGYGLGIERLLGVCTGISNIKDLVPAPRFLDHCKY